MARDFVGNFYKTTAWTSVRRSYIKSVGGLCEECYRKGIIRHGDTVHHRVPITPENINDPEVTLNPDNLILLCRECHALAHKKTKRYKVNDLGQVEAIE